MVSQREVPVSVVATRFTRALATALIVLGCSESTPPTQPVNRTSDVRVGLTRPSGDVTPATVSTTVFYACYVPDKGAVYRIKTADTPAQCEKKDVEFSWTDAGSSAGLINGLTLHSQNVTLPSDGRFFATCPAGQSVVNFGSEIPAGQSATAVFGSRPAINGSQIFWGFHGVASAVWNFYWTCADAAAATIAS